MRLWGKINKLSPNGFACLVATSISYSDCLRKLGLPTSGGSFTFLKSRVQRDQLPVKHFSRNICKHKINREKFFAELRENSSLSQRSLCRYIVRYNVIPYVCKCGVKDAWNGQALVLQLDHVNGTKDDNRVKNLRWLCPNCHSQTPTFGRRNGVVSVMA